MAFTPVANDHTAVPNWASTYTPSYLDGSQADFGLDSGLASRITGATLSQLGTAASPATVKLGKAGLSSNVGTGNLNNDLALLGKFSAPAVNGTTHRYEVTLKDIEVTGQFQVTRMVTTLNMPLGAALDWSTSPTTITVKNAGNLPNPAGATLTCWIGTTPADTVSFTYTGISGNTLTGVVGPGTGVYPSGTTTDVWVLFHFVGSGNWKITEDTRASGFTFHATTLSGSQDVNNLTGVAVASVTTANVGGGTPGQVKLTALPNGTTPNGWSIQAIDGTVTATLAASIGKTDTTLNVTSYPAGWPADPGGADLPFVVVLSDSTEQIRISGRSGTTLTLDRNYLQTSGKATAHTSGATLSTPVGVWFTGGNFVQARAIMCQLSSGQTASSLATALNAAQSAMFTAVEQTAGIMPTFGKTAFTGGTDGYLNVTSATGFPTSGMVRISTYHAMDYTGVNTGTTPHRLTGVHYRENNGGPNDTKLPAASIVWTEADGAEVLVVPAPTWGDAGDTHGGYLLLDGCSATKADPLINIWQCYPSVQQPLDFRNNVGLCLKRHVLEMYSGSIGVAIQGNTTGCTIDTFTWLVHPAAEESGGVGVRHTDLIYLVGWGSTDAYSLVKGYFPVCRTGQPEIIQGSKGTRAISDAVFQDCLYQLMRPIGAGVGFDLYSGDSNGGQNLWFDRTANLTPTGNGARPFSIGNATNTVNPAAGANANKWDIIGRTLGAILHAADGTLTLDSAAGTPTDNNVSLVIESEQLLVTAGAGTTTLTVTRAQGGTAAADHASGTAVYWQIPPPFSSPPSGNAPACLVSPLITGSTLLGTTLTSDYGSWDDPTATLTIQWYRSTDQATWVAISGETGTTHIANTAGDYYQTIVTATNSAGSTAVSSNSFGPMSAAARIGRRSRLTRIARRRLG